MAVTAKRDIHEIALDYFIEHQKELCEKYNGKELLMRGAEVVGAFDTFSDALDEGNSLFGPGNFSVQECIPGEEAYMTYLYKTQVRSCPVDSRV